MKKGAAAKKYARVLIEIGLEEKSYRETGNELRNLSSVFAANPQLMRFLLNPMHKLEDRKGLVEKIAAALKTSDALKRFLALLVENRDIRVIEDISRAYSRMEDELSGRIKVKVESPVELDEQHISKIKKKLSDMTSKDIILTVEKNPALIGGLVFKVGNTILDGSIKTQLERVRERIVGSKQ